MGHNVDLGNFGLALKCKHCKEDLDLSEVDIDCDLKTHHPFEFELNIQCQECNKENEYIFDLCERMDSE